MHKIQKPEGNVLLFIIVIVVFTIALAFQGCSALRPINDSGVAVKKEMQFSDFTTIEVKDGFEVEIVRSDTYNVTIIADKELHNNLKVRHQDDTLKIYIDPPYSHIISHKTARVAMPVLRQIDLSMNSRGTISGFHSSEDFIANLALGSSLSGDIEAENVIFDIASGSSLKLEGAADEMTLNGSGGSTAELSEFELTSAKITLTSGSKTTVNVNESMEVDLSLGSTITYIGDPTITKIEISGGSVMKPAE
jgi:hypothetical protein